MTPPDSVGGWSNAELARSLTALQTSLSRMEAKMDAQADRYVSREVYQSDRRGAAQQIANVENDVREIKIDISEQKKIVGNRQWAMISGVVLAGITAIIGVVVSLATGGPTT